ncbi:DUF3613 domain-containing protein [Variovorax boronicumulans]|uniref:DUF3613 domain-containing protein n=1 Tax=Variovorax boronicumulans TaxID=436515 RepID=UPI0012E43EF6|nr:DUF3613 domain-containing protein [Variovorax boronicumulans]MDP9919942.1 hypothetical protein [Variovorax boronicumulans]GER14342.1 DUF3613 domain-containing protein [Variovorax boronicumulans]
MKQSRLHLSLALPTAALAFMAFSPTVTAQEPVNKAVDRPPVSEAPQTVEAQAPAVPTTSVGESEPEYRSLQVGDATHDLLAWQRAGVIASPTPRPIPGAIAYRSYERYLKSFEYPIPEHLNSSVKTQSGAGK